MHLSATILCAAIFLNLLAVNFAVAQGTTFDKYFGSFNPPDYIPIDATADGSGNVYVLDIYHDRIRKLDQEGKVLLELPLVAKWLRGIEIDSLGNLYVVDLVTITVLRELGPMMTAIVVAGRSGSAYAAQIGTMQVTEEVDALRTFKALMDQGVVILN